MRTSSLLGGVIAAVVGVAGLYDDLKLSGTSTSWIDAHTASLPYLHTIAPSTLVFGCLIALGSILFLNGLRAQTKLTIDEVARLTTIRRGPPSTTTILQPQQARKDQNEGR